MRHAVSANFGSGTASNSDWQVKADEELTRLCTEHDLSPQCGDLMLLNGSWYVTHAGLLRIARRNRCNSIQTELLAEFSDPARGRWVVKATVYKCHRSKGFVGYGDADPNNVSNVVRGAELRIAETRAVNRALRKAYGIGLCSVEELGAGGVRTYAERAVSLGDQSRNGQPRLRDRLLLFIRQHQLDAEQVKLYAAHFCRTASLRETSREQVQSFLEHLAELAAQGRDKLVAELALCYRMSRNSDGDTDDQAEDKEAA